MATLVVQPISSEDCLLASSQFTYQRHKLWVHSEMCVLLFDIWTVLAVKSDSLEVARCDWLSLYLRTVKYQRCWSSRKIVSLVMMLWSFEKQLFAGSQLAGGTETQLYRYDSYSNHVPGES